MFALREEVERANADTILVIHNDHFVNFDFRCYPPFALFVGQEAKGSGVIDSATIERITGATYRKYEGKESYQSAPSRTVAESLRCWRSFGLISAAAVLISPRSSRRWIKLK
jgi:hypothetical protein